VYAISDLHADYAPNMEWVKNMESQKIVGAGRGDGKGDRDVSVLLLAGDLASDLSTLEEGLKYLKDKYDHVLFVPGNHELWCQRGDGAQKAPDSIVKLQDVMDICARCNVHTKPLILEIDCSSKNEDLEKQGRVLLLPFLSWYHADFDTEPDLPPSVLEQVSKLTYF
jgi:predicted phosphohydrolase